MAHEEAVKLARDILGPNGLRYDGAWNKTLARAVLDMEAEIQRLRHACAAQNDEVCQTLGKALGYPWFKDDQKNFPGADESAGVSPGIHTAETIAHEAADVIRSLSEWPPIETAPEDGTPVLVGNARHVWISSRCTGEFAGPSIGGAPTSGHDWFGCEDRGRPTHWMPLPPPPHGDGESGKIVAGMKDALAHARGDESADIDEGVNHD